jgi:hypothetical protein
MSQEHWLVSQKPTPNFCDNADLNYQKSHVYTTVALIRRIRLEGEKMSQK